MYHIYEEDYCDCRTYGTLRFKNIYEDYTAFNTAMTTSGIPLKITNESLQTLYYLLYARYGLSHIATSDTAQFAYQVASTIFMYGPTWEKRLDIQDKIRGWTEEELLDGATTINNLSVNPGTAPATTAFEVLSTTNQQTATRYKKSKLDGYGYLMSLLETDVTEDFIQQFSKYFMAFVGYEDAETGAVEPQTKTVTPTKSTQYVQADDGYYLDTVVVNPIPSGYIVPSGTRNITENGNYNIRNYEAVSVNVVPDLGTLNVVENGTYTGAYDTVNVNVPETTLTTIDITANGTYNAPANTGFNVINVNVEGGGGEVDFSKYETYGTNLGSIYQMVVSGSRIRNLTTYVNGDESYDAWNPPSEDTLITAAQNTVITTSGTAGSQDLNNRTFAWLYIKTDNTLYGCEVESGGGGAIDVGPTGNWAIGKTYESASISLQNGDVPSNSVLYDNFYAQMTDYNGYIQIFFIGGNTGNSYALSFSIDSNVINCWAQDGSGNRTTIIENNTAQSSVWMPSEPITICGCMFGGMLNDGTSYGTAEFWSRMAAALDTIFYIG